MDPEQLEGALKQLLCTLSRMSAYVIAFADIRNISIEMEHGHSYFIRLKAE